MLLFPFADFWWFYVAFTGFVLLMLVVDLGIFHRRSHEVSIKESLLWTLLWIVLALGFNNVFYYYALTYFAKSPQLLAIPGFDPQVMATQVALQFLTAYVMEKALAIDNIFVFVAIFGFLGIPAREQHRVLFFGILGALLFRALFIAAGSTLFSLSWVVMIFGVILILTGIKTFFVADKPVAPEKNPLLKLLHRILPVTTHLHGGRFFAKEHGRWLATPLLVCLILLEGSDIVFAFDSVPAVFAIAKEPLVVFTSNIFAVLGLRALFFVLAHVLHRITYLKYALGAVLIFVGLKMLWLDHLYEGHFPVQVSLAIILSLFTLASLASLLPARRKSVRR